jgi:hypothetical protein
MLSESSSAASECMCACWLAPPKDNPSAVQTVYHDRPYATLGCRGCRGCRGHRWDSARRASASRRPPVRPTYLPGSSHLQRAYRPAAYSSYTQQPKFSRSHRARSSTTKCDATIPDLTTWHMCRHSLRQTRLAARRSAQATLRMNRRV